MTNDVSRIIHIGNILPKVIATPIHIIYITTSTLGYTTLVKLYLM